MSGTPTFILEIILFGMPPLGTGFWCLELPKNMRRSLDY